MHVMMTIMVFGYLISMSIVFIFLFLVFLLSLIFNWEDVTSNTQDCVSPHFQTPWSSSKLLCYAWYCVGECGKTQPFVFKMMFALFCQFPLWHNRIFCSLPYCEQFFCFLFKEICSVVIELYSVPVQITEWIVDLAVVVQRLDNVSHRINRYPVDKC